MLKDLISIKNCAKVGANFYVEEKIDAPFYKAVLSESGDITVMHSNGKQITPVDWTLNIENKTVSLFFVNALSKFKDGSKYEIGMFYFPTDTPRSITYNGTQNEFMVSYMSKDGVRIDEPGKLLRDHGVRVLDVPHAHVHNDNAQEIIKKYISGVYGNMMVLQKLVGSRFKLSDMMNAHGYVIKFSDKDIYKVILNDKKSLTDGTQRKMCRDIVIKDFVSWYTSNGIFPPMTRTMVGAVSILFAKYIKETDVMSKYDLLPEDLEPPTIGKMGEMCYDFITMPDVVEIIEKNEVARNIFKILLSALNNGISKHPGDILTIDTVETFNEISDKIKAVVL